MCKKSLVSISLVASVAILFSGCATLFGGGSKQQITINSTKPMEVSIGYASDDNKTSTVMQTVTTPTTVTIAREDKNLLLTSEKNEFEPVLVEKKLNPWFWGDVLATSLLSTTVDVVTGAIWKYDDNITIESK